MDFVELLVFYRADIIALCVISMMMAISPGADFVMVTRNSISGSRKNGVFTSLGIATGLWLHIGYCIAGLAILISSSAVVFNLMKYAGAAYLIYIGYQSLIQKDTLEMGQRGKGEKISSWAAYKSGLISNSLNPKTSLFFLSIFTQLVSETTPVLMQIIYGGIICLAHVIWFCLLSVILTHKLLLNRLISHKSIMDKILGGALIVFGLRVASL